MKILVIDDEIAEVERLRGILEPLGQNVITALTGAIGLALAISERPDMAIIDTELPDMRGMEVFYHIRCHPEICDMVVMLVNPTGATEEVLEGFCLHSDFHLMRPLDARELTGLIKRCPTTYEIELEEINPRFECEGFVNMWPNTFTLQQGKCTPEQVRSKQR